MVPKVRCPSCLGTQLQRPDYTKGTWWRCLYQRCQQVFRIRLLENGKLAYTKKPPGVRL